MEAYTNLEQSKKLAEILPLESADMVYIDVGYSSRLLPKDDIDANTYPVIVSCWSLAALLSVLDFPSLTQNKEDEWEVCVPNHKSDGYIEVSADNPIDTCVSLILKLHEQNLL